MNFARRHIEAGEFRVRRDVWNARSNRSTGWDLVDEQIKEICTRRESDLSNPSLSVLSSVLRRNGDTWTA